MKFLFGIALGALGVWAYQTGKLEMLTGRSPDQLQQMFTSTTENVQAVAEKVSGAADSSIVRPSAAEVAGRPDEPLPREAPEGV